MNSFKKIILSLLLVFSLSFSFGQSRYKSDYFGIGTGINATGLLGVTYEHIFREHLGLYGNLGTGFWGYKAGIGGRYYFRDAVSGGIALNFSRAMGARNLQGELEVIQNGQTIIRPVSYNLKPVNVFNISYIKFWRMGKNSRFNLEFGYSVPLNGKSESNVEINTLAVTLTDPSKAVLTAIQPGGIVIALGFSFGL